MDEGTDDVDGALFSRISSKPSDIEKLAKNPADPGNTGHDLLDGALFSRIPSQKNDLKNASRRQERTTGHDGSEKETLECTIKPEDLSDAEDEEGHDIIPDFSRPKTTRKKNSSSSNESNSSVYDDMSDAIQGSRVSLQHFLEEQEPEIQPASTSTFFTAPVGDSRNRKDVSKNNSNGVAFYLQDSETEGIKSPGSTKYGHVSSKHDGRQSVKKGNKAKEMNGETCELANLIRDKRVSAKEQTYPKDGSEDDADRTVCVSRQDTKKTGGNKRRVYFHLLKALAFPLISLGIYIWDIGSDIRLAVSYRESGDLDLFRITLCCIIVPHFLMAIVDVSWVWLDKGRCSGNVCRFILGSLTFGRIVRALTYMRHIYKAKMLPKVKEDKMNLSDHEAEHEAEHGKTRNWHKARARDQKRDCFMLDFINAFAESAPQLFVQLYLYYAYDLELTLLRVFNLLSSWISIAWTYAAYYRCNREALKGEQDVNIVGFVFFFWSVLFALAARYVCTTLFLVYFNIWIGVVCISCHFIVMTLWIFIKEKPALEGTTVTACGRYSYYVFFAYVCILCFMNLNDSRARIRMTLFYILIYFENVIMAGLALWKMNETGSEKASHLVILPIGCIIHVVLLLNYYKCLHPKTGLCYNCDVPRKSGHSTETSL